ncbi:MAG: XRE family transcriptional regulator [Nitrospirae bacterium]|nr:MAG: XRE family transcriptional regulator [Nitrospirota bacterium]
MSLMVQLGKRIQKIRESRGLTQEQLEEKTDVNAKYISAVERGQQNVTVKTLEKIANGLGVELYQFFLFAEEFESDRAVKKAINSLLHEADTKTLTLCAAFLRKAVS